jgi:hypothetical protein
MQKGQGLQNKEFIFVVSSAQCRSGTHNTSLSSMITMDDVRILHEVHSLISLALMMIRHILLYLQKFKYHQVMLLYHQRLWTLNALQGLEVLRSKHWTPIFNQTFGGIAVLCSWKHYNFSNTALDNHWRSVYTVCMDALSSPEMQNVLDTKFPKIFSSLSKLAPFTRVTFLSIFYIW